MRYFLPILALIIAPGFCRAQASGKSVDPGTFLWYRSPASKWEEAMPVGNGRLGAMIYGGVNEAIIQFNEETYWTGGPYSTVVKGGHEKLKEIQELVFDNKMQEAQKLFGRYLMGYPVEQQKYQSMGILRLFFDLGTSKPEYYRRWLDLRTATSGVDFVADGVQYREEFLSSHPDEVIAIRITASQPRAISLRAELQGARNQAHSNYGTDYFRMDNDSNDELVVTGKSADYLGIKGQLTYEVRAKIRADGGTVTVSSSSLQVTKATSVTIYLSAATSFVNYKDVSANPHQRVAEYLGKASAKSFDEIRASHVKDYQSLFNRNLLTLTSNDSSFVSTDQRISRAHLRTDPSLAALAYQFGRYVLISSSRPGTQPANLQGIWNNDMNPAWDSKYTTNINTEMNYWAAESANLSECMDPLIQMIKELTDQGGQVAKEHYGAKGWVFHQNTDQWRVAAPMDGPTWGTFTVGGAWLLNTVWERYKYQLDREYVADIYPALKGSVEFFSDFLVENRSHKYLITNPSTSPENFPLSPGNGRYFDETTGSYLPGTTICAGSSIDMQILHDLFSNFIVASKLLNTDAELASRVQVMMDRLVPPQLGKDGSLREWTDDWGQLEANHRHFSHLYGLYPGHVLSPVKTPQLMDACKAVLEQRGDGGAGWSRAWKVALWSRLHDGERALKILKGYFHDQSYPQLFAKCFTPLQVDGTLGVTAGISEMLVQSNEDFIELLPALPKEWEQGSLTGMRVRGAFELNLEWKNGQALSSVIRSLKGTTVRLKVGAAKIRITENGKSIRHTRSGSYVIFQTQPGASYQLTFTP